MRTSYLSEKLASPLSCILLFAPPYFLNLNFNNLKVGYERSAHAIGFFLNNSQRIPGKVDLHRQLSLAVFSFSPYTGCQ
jgi:hypothetical protein